MSYDNVKAKDWDGVMAEVSSKSPDRTESINYGYIPSYKSSGDKDVRIAEFYWKAPKSGEVSFSVKADDWLKFYFGEDFDSLEELGTVSTYTNVYKDMDIKRTVVEGKYYAVRLFNVNAGGNGSASMAYKYEGDEFAVFETSDVFHPDVPIGQTIEEFVFEPQFIVSKKDNIKLSVSGTDKSEWKVVKAPENIVDGRFYTEQDRKSVV